MKLTETQIKIIAAYQAEIQAIKTQFATAKQKMDCALFLIAGREFKNYEIKEGELIIKDDLDSKTLKKQQ